MRLVRRCREGDTEAFESLVRKYQDPVFSIAYRMVGDREEARDLAQESFIRAYEAIDSYNSKMPFRSWLYRICTNASIDLLRRRGKVRSVPVEAAVVNGDEQGRAGEFRTTLELAGPESDIPENVSVANEISGYVWDALGKLPENYRAVIILHHMEGISYTEIGDVLGVPRNTAKTWGHRARGLLCEALEGVV